MTSSKAKKGFALLTPEERQQIARQGGRAAHAAGTAHEFDAEEARAAGRKGGKRLAKDREHMAAIGRRGGSSPRRTQGGSDGE